MKTIITTAIVLITTISCATKSNNANKEIIADNGTYQYYQELRAMQKTLERDRPKTMILYKGKTYETEKFFALQKKGKFEDFKSIDRTLDKKEIEALGFSTDKVNRVIIIN
ncbi:MAG: hypothetical protein JST62_14135 [Bacteroidetes bacterium]|nr:hypothetical protein [Bacteroidota bacterium]